LSCGTAALTAEQGKVIMANGVNVMPCDHILHCPKPKNCFTIRFKENVSSVEGVKRASELASKISGFAVYKTFNAIRAFSPVELNQDVVKSLGLSKMEVFIPDVPLPFVAEKRVPRGWNKVPRENGDNDAANDVTITVRPPKTIRVRLQANFLCQEEELNAVIQQIECRLVAQANSNYTDAVMAVIVEFDVSKRELVDGLLKSTITCDDGREFFISDHDHQV
jgi:hypothetical protein